MRLPLSLTLKQGAANAALERFNFGMSSITYSDPINSVVGRLNGAKRQGHGWIANCPSHNDGKPSLSVSEGNDSRVLLKCFAGCSPEQIVSAIGLEMRNLFPEGDGWSGKSNNTSQERRIEATYNYCDETGELLYQVVRYRPKDFRQRRPDGNGGWIWKLDDTRRVLYRLPELLSANADETVLIVEGEKDVEGLRELGLVATTSVAGAEKWRPEYSEYMRGRRVVILPDNDGPGRKHAVQVARTLHGIASSVKIAELPGLPEKGDVSDWLMAGGTTDRLLEIVADAAEWQASTTGGSIESDSGLRGFYSSFDALYNSHTKPAEEILIGLRRGQVGALVSSTNIGKTTLSLNHCLMLAAGEFIGQDGGQLPLLLRDSVPRRILYVDCESTADELKADIYKMLASVMNKPTAKENLAFVVEGMIHGEPLNLSRREHLEYIIQAAKNHKTDLVVVDTISSAFELVDENSNAHISSTVMKPLLRLAREVNCAVLYAHHRGKANETQTQEKAYHGRGASAFGALSRAVFTLERYPKAGDGYVKLECVKAKGSFFEPVLLRLDFESRWFSPSDERPLVSEMLTAEMITEFVKSKDEALTREIHEKFDRFGQTTIKRRIDEAKRLGLIEQVKQGIYRHASQAQIGSWGQPYSDDPVNQISECDGDLLELAHLKAPDTMPDGCCENCKIMPVSGEHGDYCASCFGQLEEKYVRFSSHQ
jgi:putative DNA primase/helicase